VCGVPGARRRLRRPEAPGLTVFSRSAHLYDAIYSYKDYAAEAERLHGLVEARALDARSLLDVACGTGMHLGELRRWYEVEGVDVDPQLLAIARERLSGVPLHQADMTTLDLGRTFDVVTCLFSSIAYVRTPEGLVRATAALARHVAPGGLLVVEPWILPGGTTSCDAPLPRLGRPGQRRLAGDRGRARPSPRRRRPRWAGHTRRSGSRAG